MLPNDPNLAQLRLIAEALGDLRHQLVFVGGSIAGLLMTDPLADAVRATMDVDAVVEAGRVAFFRLEDEIAARGFMRDSSSEVICRWKYRDSGVLFDLMPVEASVLGFTNRWYQYAMQTATPVDLGNGITIRLASAVAFVATKLDAFIDRGQRDFMTSHDLEDVLGVVDGRAELADELALAPVPLRQAVAATFAELLSNPDFKNVLPGLLSDDSRTELILDRLTNMSAHTAP